MARPEKIRLGEILLRQNLMTEEQLQFALIEQKRTGRKLGRVFVENKFVTEDQISDAMARQLNISFVNLKQYNIKPTIVKKLPELQARRFRAIVLEELDLGHLVAMVDPTDLFAYDEISRILKSAVQLAVVNENDLLEAIDNLYRHTDVITGLARELEQELSESEIDLGDLGAAGGAEDAPVVKLLQSVFDDATQARASDIHIEPQDKRLQIRFRIDGVLHLQTEADIKIAGALALRLKLISEMDISEKRLPQDGRFIIKVRQYHIDVRISTMPTQYGESIVMRLLNQSGGILNLDKIGMPREMLARFRAIIQRPNGLVLVTGPTGSGKTTTLYGALAELNKEDSKLITVEDPVEYRLPGINQVQVNEKIDLTFAKVLRASLRQDPDILLLGEMRDQETAQIGMRAAMTGHLVLSTLHTNDAISTPIRLLDMGVPRYMMGSSLQGVLAQRLVRVICESCRVVHSLSPSEHEWLAQDLGAAVDQHQYHEGRGCGHCNGTGFRGRIGVYELLEMTKDVVNAAYFDDNKGFIDAARAQMGGNTLRKYVIDLVLSGVTTMGEAMRISNQIDE